MCRLAGDYKETKATGMEHKGDKAWLGVRGQRMLRNLEGIVCIVWNVEDVELWRQQRKGVMEMVGGRWLLVLRPQMCQDML